MRINIPFTRVNLSDVVKRFRRRTEAEEELAEGVAKAKARDVRFDWIIKKINYKR